MDFKSIKVLVVKVKSNGIFYIFVRFVKEVKFCIYV